MSAISLEVLKMRVIDAVFFTIMWHNKIWCLNQKLMTHLTFFTDQSEYVLW